MTISIPLKWEIAPQQSLYYNQDFSRFGTHFDDTSKILTLRQISPNIFACKLSYENNSQAESNWVVLKEAPAYKIWVLRSAHPQYE